jgi:hypothetical protein
MVFAKTFKAVGFESRSGEEGSIRTTRKVVLEMLAKCDDEQVIALGLKAFRNQQSTINPDLRGVIYSLVASKGTQEDIQLLRKLHSQTSFAEERKRIESVMGFGVKRAEDLKERLHWADQCMRMGDIQNIYESIAAGGESGRDCLWNYLTQEWSTWYPKFREKYAVAVGPILKSVISKFTCPDKVHAVGKFFEQNPCPEGDRAIQQGIEVVHNNVNRLQREKDTMNAWLSQNVQ